MTDWVDRKKQRLASRVKEEEGERQRTSQILASARPFWEDMLESMEKSRDAWNTDRGIDEIFIHKAASSPDSFAVIVRGPDGELTIELHYNMPQIRCVVSGTRQTSTFHFSLDHGEIRIHNKANATARHTSLQAADFFLDQVLR